MNDDDTAIHLGLDLDGLLDEANAFFRPLTRVWPGRVTVITYRSDRAEAERDLDALGIDYDEVVLVDALDAKAAVIAEKGIGVYVDDQPEALGNIPEGVHVLLYRNGGNFDFDDRRWMFSDRTGKRV